MPIEDREHVLIVGPRRCGKTALAAELLRESLGAVVVDALVPDDLLFALVTGHQAAVVITTQSVASIKPAVRGNIDTVYVFPFAPASEVRRVHATFVDPAVPIAEFERLLKSVEGRGGVRIDCRNSTVLSPFHT